MTEAAVAVMGDIDRLVVGPAGIVTARAGCAKDILDTTDGHIAGRNMGRMQHCLVGVTRQAVGRVGAQGEGVDHLLPRAVVTGGTGAGAVGVDIVLGVDFRPVRHGMAAAAGCPAGQVTGAQGHGMPVVGMQRVKGPGMAGRTVARRRLADGRSDQDAGIGVMTADAGVVGLGCCADQGVIVTAAAAGAAHCDEAAMIIGGRRVIRLPGVGVAGGTVARPGLADGRADQGAAAGVMAADSGVVGLGCGTDQSIAVAVGTAGCTDGDQTAVVEGRGRVIRFPRVGMAGDAVAAGG